MQETSITLLQRISERGREEDWKRFLDIYTPFIRYQIKQFPLLKEQADDIYQDIVSVLVSELPTFERRHNYALRGWLRKICRNRLLTAARQVKRDPRNASSQAALEAELNALEDDQSEISLRWEADHDREVLRRACELVRVEFSQLHWEAFQMQVMDDIRPPNVAAQLSTTINVVRLAKSRILKRVREELDGIVEI